MLEQVHVFSILFSQIIIKKQVKKQLKINQAHVLLLGN